MRPKMAIHGVRQHGRHVVACKVEPAQDFLCDGARNVFSTIGLRIKPDYAQRVPMLPADQVGDGVFIVGAFETGLGERGTVSAVAVYDYVEILRRGRSDRRAFTHTQHSRYTAEI